MRTATAFTTALILAILFLPKAGAEIKKSDLDKKVVVTEEAALLSQVDTVSLYLSSDKIAFAPRLSKERKIEVETTVLDKNLASNSLKMKEYVSRLCGTFISVLGERLPVYAPSIAAKFDASKDIVFNVNAGAARAPVGVWAGGAWQGTTASAVPAAVPAAAAEAVAASKSADEINQTRAEESEEKTAEPGRKGCNCPARK